jgi:hypothetical protein
VLVGLALWGAAVAVRDKRRPVALALLAASLVGLLVAVGVAEPVTEPLARSVYRWVPGSMIFREPHKAVSLVALGYAWLGAVAVGWLLSAGSKLLRVTAFIALALPIVFTWQIFGGVGGRLRPVEYPNSWKAADSLLRMDRDRFSVLVLPWELYLPLPFNDPGDPVADPAPDFFSVPIVASNDPDLGAGLAPPKDPLAIRIEALLARHETLTRMGFELSRLGIKYVLFIPTPVTGSYGFLFRQGDLEVLARSRDLVLFRNLDWPGPGR